MGNPAIAAAAVIALALAGCATDERSMPALKLPAKPVSTDIPCEDLTADEEIVCLGQSQQARDVCRKVQRNRVICEDQQQFVRRLYKERDGR